MSDVRSSHPWVTATLVLLAAGAVAADLSRLQAPQGERYVNYMDVWPSDFRAGLEATRSLLAGNDPYRVALPGAKASDRFVVDGVTYRYCYPPSHLLLYVPIALATRQDEIAGRVAFHLLFVILFGLALIVWRLADAVVATPALVVAVLLPLLALQPGTMLALERVQSDVVLSLFCWSAVALAAAERWGWASFFAIAAALMKPYASLLAIGIACVGVDRAQRRASVIGVVAALVLMLAPVARFVRESAAAVGPRSELFWPSWQNWGLRGVGWAIDHAFAAPGRVFFCGLCALAAALAWLCVRRALRAGDPAGVVLWLVLFAVCALEAVIGWSRTAYTYAMIYLLPGLLVIALAQPALAERLTLTAREQLVLAPALVASLLAFWTVRPWWSQTSQPIAGFAVVAIVWLILTCTVAQLLGARWRARGSAPARS